MRLYYFNIPLDDQTLEESLVLAQSYLNDDKQHYIVTPNPEMVVLSSRDRYFRSALGQADLSLIDGVGLQIAVWLLGGIKPHRIPGTIFLEELLRRVGSSQSVFWLGAEGGVAQIAATKAKQKYDTVTVGTYEPKRLSYDYGGELRPFNQAEHLKIISAINSAKPRILILALGHNLQEKWIQKYLSACPSVKLAMGVGGALNYLSGQASQPPSLLRRLGLEWLWRLLTQPTRFRRIFTATVVFPSQFIRWFFGQNFSYRPSVVACILNRAGEILIVSRIDDPDHWQLPQGGVDEGETMEEAVVREMGEELGTTAFDILGRSKQNIHKYSWKRRGLVSRQDFYTQTIRRYGYRGQTQTVFFLRFKGDDADLVLDQRELARWRWVKPADLAESLHLVRRPIADYIMKELHVYQHTN